MADIKYSPEELIAQSAEMSALQSEYDALFKQVTSALNSMNDSWSENLSRNFAAKIQSAQKAFMSITNMLGNGAAAAKLGATSHSPTSIESFLSMIGNAEKSIANLFDKQEYSTILTDDDKKQLYQMIPENLRKDIGDAQRVDKWVQDNYEKLPEAVRKGIEKIPGVKQLKDGYSIASDIIQGEVSTSTIGKMATAVTGDPMNGTVITALLDAGYNKKLEQFTHMAEDTYEKSGNAFRSGDIGGGALYLLEGVGYEMQKFTYAFNDSWTNIGGILLEGTHLPIIKDVGTALRNMM